MKFRVCDMHRATMTIAKKSTNLREVYNCASPRLVNFDEFERKALVILNVNETLNKETRLLDLFYMIETPNDSKHSFSVLELSSIEFVMKVLEECTPNAVAPYLQLGLDNSEIGSILSITEEEVTCDDKPKRYLRMALDCLKYYNNYIKIHTN